MTVNEACKIDEKCYKIKSKWIKSLTHENVVIDNALGSYIFEKGLELNKLFDSFLSCCSYIWFPYEIRNAFNRKDNY